MTAYYNEWDDYAADWLENLIAAGHLPPGDVDRRSITEVSPDDLKGYHEAHFFAGIGGWPLALRLAGWEGPVWTGSPPCQEVSNAGSVWGVRCGLEGQRTGLVRPWLDLVERLQPRTLFFENVPGIKQWIAEIKERLEGAGYRISQSERSTSDIGGPHLRRRVWLAANRDGKGLEEPRPARSQAPFSDPRRAPPGDFWTPSARRVGWMDGGLSPRMAIVRAFGNSIDPQVAAEFIMAYMEAQAPAPLEQPGLALESETL